MLFFFYFGFLYYYFLFLTWSAACDTNILFSAVTKTDGSTPMGDPFLSHEIFGIGAPFGGVQRISVRPPNSTRTDDGMTENCFFISEIK